MIRSVMWPFYILSNKLLTADDANVHGPDEISSVLVQSQQFRDQLCTNKCHSVALPPSHFVLVPHIKQLRNWDCGLSCVLMVLRTIGIDSCDLATLEELCPTTSIWTVDLAYLLQKFSVCFSYFTVTLGANRKFKMEKFYKDHLSNDLPRVDMLFQKALEAGINIQCRSISETEISFMILSGKFIAIALVDQYKFSKSWLEDVCVSGIYDDKSGYTGHYVVICGYDAWTDEFEIRDPASSRTHERIASKSLENARKSFGTDEDLLVVSLKTKDKQNQNRA